MLTTQAFNALLKTLEEPPGFVKFILATTDPLKLPATILSRTQHFRFNKIATQDVMHHLSHILNEENIDFETPALEILTRSGQGSLRDTLTLLDQAIIFSKGKVSTTAVVDMLGLIEPELMDKLFDIILKKEDFTSIVRELESYEISQVCDEMTIYLKQKMLEKDAKFDLLLFDRFFRILSDAKHLLALNSDGGFVLILTLSKMIEATNLKSIDDIINQVEEISVKPVMKDAISTKKVLEHAKNDTKHAYDDEPVSISQQYETTKNIVVQEEVIEVDSETTISIDSVNAIPTVEPVEVTEPEVQSEDEFATPFDEPLAQVVSQEVNETKVEEEPKEQVEQSSSEEVQEQSLSQVEEEPSSQESQEPQKVQEQVEEKKPEPEVYDPNVEKYKTLIAKVYERDYELGDLFEQNFIYKKYDDKKLEITSYAQGEERKFLLKHYGILKIFIYDIFGNDTDIEFIKEEREGILKKHEFQREEVPSQPLEQNSDSVGSMIEDVEVGSGCVADMQKTANPSPAQRELEMNDVLNSAMLNKAKELFDIKKITVKTKT